MNFMHELVLPNRLTSYEVQESNFARAYDMHNAQQRAWLKKNISQLYAWYNKHPFDSQSKKLIFHCGLRSTLWEKKYDWALFVVEHAFLSPAQLLAAILPAIMSQVQEIFVVRIKPVCKWSSSQLLALELAGIENVFDLPDVGDLLNILKNWSLNGGIFLLESAGENLPLSLKNSFDSNFIKWRVQEQHKAGLWMDKEYVWDIEQIAWSQPNTLVNVWMDKDLKVQLPKNWIKKSGKWEEFLDQGFEVLYLPCFEQAQFAFKNSASLCLGPGQEGCWLWPDLELRNFFLKSVCWSD